MEGGGFEPPKASPTDLQSVPFGHSGTPPPFSCTRWKPWQRHGSENPALNQPALPILWWSWRWDLNPQPADYKSAALPIELRQRSQASYSVILAKSTLFPPMVKKAWAFHGAEGVALATADKGLPDRDINPCL